ncbi:MAG: hypothetical protein ACREOG_15105 [Gemmatimonadaceae bacterium]
MSLTPEHDRTDSASAPEATEQRTAEPAPVVLRPLSGPTVPDMTAHIEESRKQHEAELAAAQKLVARARAGSPLTFPERTHEPLPPPAPGEHRVAIDWRGETAHYIEYDRRVRLACMYWGGPSGRVSHIDGFWEYGDDRRERLTSHERARILQHVIEHARRHHDIVLEIERG